MANSWQIRAEKFMKQFLNYISDYEEVNKYWRVNYIDDAVTEFNAHYKRHMSMAYGSARVCIIGPDYVIKMDYNTMACNDIGGCEREYRVYQKLSQTEYSYLLAPMHRFEINGKYYYAMKKFNHIGDDRNADDEYGWTWDEREFLKQHMNDLHAWNVGMYKGKGVVIDYACPIGRWNFTDCMH